MKSIRLPALAGVLTILLFASGCAHKKAPAPAPPTSTGGSETVTTPPETTANEVPPTPSVTEVDALNDIYFDFDSSDIREDQRSTLDGNGTWMLHNTSATVQIEGHCDERGTVEYNLALGERRAQGAKGYLVSFGVPDARLTTISYGEERPADPGHDENAWAKNRRCHFVVASR